MQKTYDECYLICSTAVYFEGQVSEPHPTSLVHAASPKPNTKSILEQ